MKEHFDPFQNFTVIKSQYDAKDLRNFAFRGLEDFTFDDFASFVKKHQDNESFQDLIELNCGISSSQLLTNKNLGYQVNICCEADVSNNDESKYILVYAGDKNELKEATEYTLENGRFFLVGNLQHSGIDYNQILRFYDKDDELKMIHFTTSSQFHNAEMIAREILSNDESFAYATADLKGDIAAIARIDDNETKKVKRR